MMVPLGSSLSIFCFFRFLLGAGESANWPGATKAVAEWFPRSEKGWAVALFDSGSSVGGAIAPFLAYWVYQTTGGWRSAFFVTGILGLLWIPFFRSIYRKPEEHPLLSESERKTLLETRATELGQEDDVRLPYSKLLRMPQTWGVVLSKTLTDPVWFFITDWFAIFLVSKGYAPIDSLLAFWIPFLAADIGNFAGGGISSYLIPRGWRVGAARKIVCVVGAVGMAMIALPAFVNGFAWMVASFAVSTLCYAAFSTIILTLPADLYPASTVASVSGMSGTGAGIGTIAATLLIGVISDHYSFEPILVAASIVPLIAAALILMFIRNTDATPPGIAHHA